jgi:ubiquinone/menaquinone biosynthesis C-methylase UbiE
MSRDDAKRRAGDLSAQIDTAIPATLLLGQMWCYAATVLYPARLLRLLNVYQPNAVGTRPSAPRGAGAGPFFSLRQRAPSYLEQPVGDASVDYFDTIAAVYDCCVQPFTRPIFDQAATLLKELLPPAARVLDAGCGPGTETLLLARLVPDGEVVGIDLAAGMVKTAFDTARRRGVRNVAFFQADVAALPQEFGGRFDAVVSFGAFHHYPDPAAALREMHRVLSEHGRAVVIDPGPGWFKALGTPWAKWADPGWVSFYTAEELQRLFTAAGFSQFYWNEVLPGFGLTVADR